MTAVANEVFKAGVKCLLVIYILLTPRLSMQPVKIFVESPMFVAVYLTAVVAIAHYDRVASALLAIVMSIWIIKHGSATIQSNQQQLQRFMNNGTVDTAVHEDVVSKDTVSTDAAIQPTLTTVRQPSGMKQVHIIHHDSIEDVSVEEPIAQNAYDPLQYEEFKEF